MALLKEDLQAISNLLDIKLQPINNRLDGIDNRLDKLESEVSALKVGQQAISQEIRHISDKVDKTYDLALDNWDRLRNPK